jgi:hypothetical protein
MSMHPSRLEAATPPASVWSRRRFLKAGLFGTVGIFVLGATLAARKTVVGAHANGALRVLSAEQYAVLSAVAERICPPPAPGAPGAAALGVAQSIDAMLAEKSALFQRDVKSVLWMVENALVSALFLERVRPFTQLSAAEQDATLDAMRRSSVPLRRTMFAALRGLCAATYFGDQRTWTRMGYEGPPDVAGLRAGFAMNLVDFDSLKAPPKG